MTYSDAARAGALNALRGYRDRITNRQHQQDQDLKQRARQIVAAHRNGAGQGEIAAAAGISPQRVSQIILKGTTP